MDFSWSVHVWPRVVATFALALFLFDSSGCRVWQRTRVTSASTLESRQFVQQAARSIEEKNLENAESQLKLAVKANPENIEARSMLADSLWNHESYSEAIKEMERVARHPEVQPEQLVKLAWMHFERQNYPQAQKYVSRALGENNGIADAWILQGRLYELEEKPSETLSAYHQAVFLDPDNEKTQTLLARQYLEVGKAQRALEVAQTVRSKTRGSDVNAELLLCEGTALMRLQRNSEAVQILRQANAQTPDNVRVLSALAQAQYRNRDFGQAFQTATRGLELEPGNSVLGEIAGQIQTASAGSTGNRPVASFPSPPLPSLVPAETGARYGREVKEEECSGRFSE